MSATSNFVFGIFCGLVGVVGIPGNLLVLMVYVPKSRKTPSDVIVIWMATLDIIISSMVSLPLSYQLLTSVETEFLCRALNFSQVASSLVNFQVTAVVAVDRYCAVCYPHRRIMTKRRANIVIASCCSLGIAAASPALFSFHVVYLEGFGRDKCWPNFSYLGGVIALGGVRMLAFSALLILIITLYSRIAHVVRKQRRVNQKAEKDNSHQSFELTANVTKRDAAMPPTRLFVPSSSDAGPSTSGDDLEDAGGIYCGPQQPSAGSSTLRKETLDMRRPVRSLPPVSSVPADDIPRETPRPPHVRASDDSKMEVKEYDHDAVTDAVESFVVSSSPYQPTGEDVASDIVSTPTIVNHVTQRQPTMINGSRGLAPQDHSCRVNTTIVTSTSAPADISDVQSTYSSSEVRPLATSIGRQQVSTMKTPPMKRKLETFGRRIRKRTTRMLIVITIIVVVTYMPQVLLPFVLRNNTDVDDLVQKDTFRQGMLRLMNQVTLLNSALNPFVYTFMNSKFRREVVARWRSLRGICC